MRDYYRAVEQAQIEIFTPSAFIPPLYEKIVKIEDDTCYNEDKKSRFKRSIYSFEW